MRQHHRTHVTQAGSQGASETVCLPSMVRHIPTSNLLPRAIAPSSPTHPSTLQRIMPLVWALREELRKKRARNLDNQAWEFHFQLEQRDLKQTAFHARYCLPPRRLGRGVCLCLIQQRSAPYLLLRSSLAWTSYFSGACQRSSRPITFALSHACTLDLFIDRPQQLHLELVAGIYESWVVLVIIGNSSVLDAHRRLCPSRC